MRQARQSVDDTGYLALSNGVESASLDVLTQARGWRALLDAPENDSYEIVLDRTPRAIRARSNQAKPILAAFPADPWDWFSRASVQQPSRAAVTALSFTTTARR